MLQSIVCHDSRAVGGRDLLDKELSFLIWNALKGKKKVHFATIMDCCFSGENTRLYGLEDEGLPSKVRMRSPKLTPEDIKTFLGYEHYQVQDEFAKAPVGRHIGLAASKSNETAKEVFVKGEPRGIFTYSLIHSLQSAGRNIPYQELMKRTKIKVQQHVKKQSPQMLFNHKEDRQRIFLDGAAKDYKKHYLVYFDRSGGWKVNGGRLDGFTEGDIQSRTKFQLIEEEHQVIASKVFPTHSSVEGMNGFDKKETYEASLEDLAVEKLKVYLAPNVDQHFQDLLQEQLNSYPSDFIDIVQDPALAKYGLQQSKTGLGVRHIHDERFLTTTNQELVKQGMIDFVKSSRVHC